MKNNKPLVVIIFLCVFLTAAVGAGIMILENRAAGRLVSVIRMLDYDQAMGERFQNELDQLKREAKSSGNSGVRQVASLIDETVESKSTIIWALALLTDLRRSEVVLPAIQLVRKSQDVEVVTYAVRALQQLKDERGLKPLIELFKTRAQNELWFETGVAIASFREPETLEVFAKLASIPSINYFCAFVYGQFDPLGNDFLLQNLTDSNPDARMMAAWLLGRWLQDERAIAPLKTAVIKEKYLEVKQAMIVALSYFGDPEILVFLRKLQVEETDSEMKSFIANTVANIERLAQKDVQKLRDLEQTRNPSKFTAISRVINTSAGAKGSITELVETAGPQNLTELLEIRRALLNRITSDALNNYELINKEIRFLRWASRVEK